MQVFVLFFAPPFGACHKQIALAQRHPEITRQRIRFLRFERKITKKELFHETMGDACRAGEAMDPQSVVQLVNELARKQASKSGIRPAAQRDLKHSAFSILLGYSDVPSMQVRSHENGLASRPEWALLANPMGRCDISYKKMGTRSVPYRKPGRACLQGVAPGLGPECQSSVAAAAILRLHQSERSSEADRLEVLVQELPK